MFDAAGGVTISVTKRVFPTKFEPTPAGKQPLAVVRPASPFGRHCCPGISKPVPADGNSSWSGSGSILPSTSFSKLTHTSDDISELRDRGLQGSAVSIDAIVTCAASRPRLSTNCLILVNSSSVKLIVSGAGLQ